MYIKIPYNLRVACR